MHETNHLRGVDLNLLMVLEALLAERHAQGMVCSTWRSESFPSSPRASWQHDLFVERLVYMGDRRHRAFRGGLTLARHCAAPHALVAVRGLDGGDALNEIDTALAAICRTRCVQTVWPHFLGAPCLVLGTDLLLIIAERTVSGQLSDPELAVHTLPFEVAAFSFVAVHRPDALEDEGRSWLLQQIMTASRGSSRGAARGAPQRKPKRETKR